MVWHTRALWMCMNALWVHLLRGCLGLSQVCWDLIGSGGFCMWLKMCRVKPCWSGLLAGCVYVSCFYLFTFLASLSPSNLQRQTETWWGQGINGKIAACEPGSICLIDSCSAWAFRHSLFPGRTAHTCTHGLIKSHGVADESTVRCLFTVCVLLLCSSPRGTRFTAWTAAWRRVA